MENKFKEVLMKTMLEYFCEESNYRSPVSITEDFDRMLKEVLADVYYLKGYNIAKEDLCKKK